MNKETIKVVNVGKPDIEAMSGSEIQNKRPKVVIVTIEMYLR